MQEESSEELLFALLIAEIPKNDYIIDFSLILLLFNRYNRFIVIRDFWPFSEISGTLLDRLDETVDRDAESAWEAEIVMRLKEIDESKVNLIPWAEARARIAEP